MTNLNPSWNKLQYETDRLMHYRDFLRFRSDKFSTVRLIIFVSTLLLSFVLFILGFQWSAVILFVVGIAALSIVVHFHNQFILFTRKIHLLFELKKIKLARVELNWRDLPVSSETSNVKSHLLNDLDITGENSLFRLIDCTISKEGQTLLLEWLALNNSSLEDAKEKTILVQELKSHEKIRDRIFISMNLFSKKNLIFSVIREVVKSKNNIPKVGKPLIAVAFGLVYLMIGLFVVSGLGIVTSSYWLIPLLIYFVLYFSNSRKIETAFENVSMLSDELKKLSSFTKAAESFQGKNLPELNKVLKPIFEYKPSVLIDQCEKISSGISARENLLMKLFLNLIFPWDIFYYYKLSKTLNKLKDGIDEWINALIKFDALNSLAEFAFLNPHYTQAELCETSFTLELQDCGHPLINPVERIRNDFNFYNPNQVVLITGSNMSGKSTFLRTVGLNLVLAYNGVPACAKKMKVSFYQIFSCIRINDSVADGISYFYSEVKRLKELYDLINVGQRPVVLFLIDEIFKGTNNIERLKGSRDFIRSIAGKNSCGFISTHDLELTKLDSEIHTLRNYHFREDVNGNIMTFDYKIYNGPCPTTNALKLMQSAGLPVTPD